MAAIWVDTDMGFDDLAAVLTLAHSPGVTIAGMSLAAGNAPLGAVQDNAARAAEFFDWRFPIHCGRDRPVLGPLVTAQSILGDDAMRSAGAQLPDARRALSGIPALPALVAALENAPEPLRILAIGPLTNIAVLALARPDLASRIADIVWMGGSAGPGNHTAAAEFNALVDPEAAQIVIEWGVAFRMVGLDVCRQVRVDHADAARLRAVGTERARILADLFSGYVAIAGAAPDVTMALYDPVAAAVMVDPQCLAFAPAHLAFECARTMTRGASVVEWRVPRRAAANALVANAADSPRIRAVMLDALERACRNAGDPS